MRQTQAMPSAAPAKVAIGYAGAAVAQMLVFPLFGLEGRSGTEPADPSNHP